MARIARMGGRPGVRPPGRPGNRPITRPRPHGRYRPRYVPRYQPYYGFGVATPFYKEEPVVVDETTNVVVTPAPQPTKSLNIETKHIVLAILAIFVLYKLLSKK